MYSDSVDESATVGCFFAAQDTAPPAKQNKYPPTDFLSTSPPQFASLYTFISNPTFPSNVIPRLLVPQRYLKMQFAVASCSSEGWLLNCEILRHCICEIRMSAEHCIHEAANFRLAN